MDQTEFANRMSKDRLRNALDAVQIGFNDYLSKYTEVSHVHHPRTRASSIHDHISDNMRRFVSDPDVNAHFFSKSERNFFQFDDTILLTFKKLDERLQGSNIQTQTAMRFLCQMELEGIPVNLDRVTIGYVPREDFTAINGVYAVSYDFQGNVEWSLDLISYLDDDDGAEQKTTAYGT